MPSIQEQSSADNQCAQGSPLGAGRTETSQKEERANAGECQQYHEVEPIFDGSLIKIPFFKDHICPGTFVLFSSDDASDNIGRIITNTPTGDVRVNVFCAPHPEDNVRILGHSYLEGTSEVS